MKSAIGAFLGAITVAGVCALPVAAAPTADHGIITFDAPGADTKPDDGGNGTLPSSIKDFGVIVGAAHDANRIYHGFLRSPDGRFTRFDVAGAGTAPGSNAGTLPQSINDLGEIAGYYIDTNKRRMDSYAFRREK